MPTLVVETRIAVPVERCFDLARDIDLHCETARHTGERAVAGVITGKIGAGESVTFEGVHFGIRQRLTARITAFDPPHCFIDTMTQGAFAELTHIHEFIAEGEGTRMRDTIRWVSPLGVLGVIADKLLIERHLHDFLIRRNAALKKIAEEKQ